MKYIKLMPRATIYGLITNFHDNSSLIISYTNILILLYTILLQKYDYFNSFFNFFLFIFILTNRKSPDRSEFLNNKFITFQSSKV